MKKMFGKKLAFLLAAAVLAAGAFTSCEIDFFGSGHDGNDDKGKTPSETFKKFDVSEDGVYYVNKAGEISAEKKDGYVFKVLIFLGDEYNPYICSLEEYTGSDSSLSIPEGITGIHYKTAFDGCEELTSVIFPKGIYGINRYAFNECAALTTVEFKGGLHSGYIGKYAFYNCDKLVTVKYAGTKEQWNSIAPSDSYSSFISGGIFYSENIEDYSGKRVTVECKDGKLKAGGYNGYFEDAE